MNANTELQGFAPISSPACRMLILGSFPGVASLRAGHYYAHPSNQFWRIISACIEQDLLPMSFEARYQALLAKGIALWDVIQSCQRPGSLDSDIRHPQAAALPKLISVMPDLEKILLNGRLAQKGARQHEWPFSVSFFDLPSTSAANASQSFEQKLRAWRQPFLQPEPSDE